MDGLGPSHRGEADQVTKEIEVIEDRYWGNVLNSFENGVQLDLRVKLAVDFLKSQYFQSAGLHRGEQKPAEVPGLIERIPGPEVTTAARDARVALDLAEAVLEEAAKRGLVKELPDNGEIPAPMKHHIARSVAASAFQAEESQRAAARLGRPIMGMQ